jgi:hypothetical protein
MTRRALLAVGILVGVAACGDDDAATEPSTTTTTFITAVELTTTTGPASTTTTSAVGHHWSGTAHIDGKTDDGVTVCTGTVDYTFELDVAADGAITGEGTGEYPPYICDAPGGPVTAPGDSGTFTVSGELADGVMTFWPSSGFTGNPLGPFIPPPGDSVVFTVPVAGDRAVATLHGDHNGSTPADNTMTIDLVCTDC